MPRKKAVETETVIVSEPVTAPVEPEKKAAPAKKPAAKRTTAKTPAAKKPAARTTSAKKSVAKETVVVEFAGKQISTDEIVAKVKETCASESTAAIKTLEVYINTDESAAYYVVNGVAEGKKIDL